MQQGVALPEDLAAMPPGPELAAVLASIDLAATANEDLPVLLQARYRQVAHEQAGLYEVMAQIGVADPERWFSAARRARPQKYWSDEVRAALTWTRRAAEYHTDLAWALHAHLPTVAEALRAGVIDLPRARVFADHLGDLSRDQAAALVAWVLPMASGWTTGQLAARLRALVADLDPAHFEQRYRRAVAGREVVGMLCDDGTVTITAAGLPADQAQDAIDRIDRLALAIRRAGHPAPVAHLRADVFLGLLDGSLHRRTRDQIIADFLARAAAEDTGNTTTGPTTSPPEQDTALPAASADTRDTYADGTVTAGSTATGTAGAPSTAAPSTTADGTGAARTCADDRASGTGQAESARPGAGPGADAAPDDELADDARRGIHVRAALSTLLGQDDRHVVLPGQGPIPASVGRHVVARQHRALWCFAIVDQQGRFRRSGVVRARPSSPTTRRTRTGPAATHLAGWSTSSSPRPSSGTRSDRARTHSRTRFRTRSDRTGGRSCPRSAGRSTAPRTPTPTTRPDASRAPPHPTTRPDLQLSRLPRTRRTVRSRPHRRPRPWRAHNSRRPRPCLPPRPWPQAGRLDPRPARARSFPLDEPVDLPSRQDRR